MWGCAGGGEESHAGTGLQAVAPTKLPHLAADVALVQLFLVGGEGNVLLVGSVREVKRAKEV